MTSLLIAALVVAPAYPTDPEADLRTEVEALKKEVRDLKARRDLDNKILADRLDRIENLLLRAIERNPTGPYRSGFTPATTTGRGTVRLENRMPVTGYVTLNGVLHTVRAYDALDVAVTAGSLNYTLGGAGLLTGPETRSRVDAGERLTITIRPPG